MIKVYTRFEHGAVWLRQNKGKKPLFACVLGFTNTGLIPGISAAGATPEDRQYTAIADAEFLVNGPTSNPKYPLPPLEVGASPVLISRAVVEAFNLQVYLFNAGLPTPPAVSAIDLGGIPANCVSSGEALPLDKVKHLFDLGLAWGKKLAHTTEGYVIIGECVVGGTTTAQAILTGLGIDAAGKVNSSHPRCNHQQKQLLVASGLAKVQPGIDPLALVAAVGDPMQVVAAGMAIAASHYRGVMLAGGTQMLAVYSLIWAILDSHHLKANLEQIVVGTTRWVADDTTGDTIGLAQAVGNVPLLATQLNFADSSFSTLRAYELGYVKEGVGAGGCAIAAHLLGWDNSQLVSAIDRLAEKIN